MPKSIYSPFVNPSGAKVADCDIVRDPAKWGADWGPVMANSAAILTVFLGAFLLSQCGNGPNEDSVDGPGGGGADSGSGRDSGGGTDGGHPDDGGPFGDAQGWPFDDAQGGSFDTGPVLDAQQDAEQDAGETDAGDGGEVADTGGVDAGPADGGRDDAGQKDGGSTDAGADAGNLDAGSDAGVPYDEDGPLPYTTQTEQVSNGGRSYNVTTYLPTAAGSHPLVSFWCGTQQTAAGYAPYGGRLASHGIAMMIADDPGVLTKTSDMVPMAVYLVDTWVPSRFAGSVDLARVGLSGHSRGGALTLFAADQGLRGKVAAWLGLNANDNPLQNSVLARTILPNIGIPNGFLGAGVATDCAPTTQNYVTLYPLAPSPSVLVVFNGANHTQFESPDGCLLCGLCMPAGTADTNVVLARALRYFTAFFARELLGDNAVGPAFEGAGAAADVAAGAVTISSK